MSLHFALQSIYNPSNHYVSNLPSNYFFSRINSFFLPPKKNFLCAFVFPITFSLNRMCSFKNGKAYSSSAQLHIMFKTQRNIFTNLFLIYFHLHVKYCIIYTFRIFILYMICLFFTHFVFSSIPKLDLRF